MTEKERDQILLSLQENVLTLKDDVSVLKDDVSALKDNVSSIQKNLSSLEKDHNNLSGSVAVIEVEHGNNIQLLLDGQVSILEKLDSFDNRFESNEKDLVNHSNRIWNLEDHVGII